MEWKSNIGQPGWRERPPGWLKGFVKLLTARERAPTILYWKCCWTIPFSLRRWSFVFSTICCITVHINIQVYRVISISLSKHQKFSAENNETFLAKSIDILYLFFQTSFVSNWSIVSYFEFNVFPFAEFFSSHRSTVFIPSTPKRWID